MRHREAGPGPNTHTLRPPPAPLLTSSSTRLRGIESGGPGDPRKEGLPPHEDEGLKERKVIHEATVRPAEEAVGEEGLGPQGSG